MALFLQLLFNGFSIGAVYALIVVGYSLVYGVLQFVNFAHGDLCMVGAYAVLASWTVFGPSTLLAVIVGVSCVTLLGLGIERVAYRPLQDAPRLGSV